MSEPSLSLLAALLLAPLAALHAASGPAPTKQSFVFILVDDMAYAGPSVTGHPVMETPHMDRIAKQGIIFSRASTGRCADRAVPRLRRQGMTDLTPINYSSDVS